MDGFRVVVQLLCSNYSSAVDNIDAQTMKYTKFPGRFKLATLAPSMISLHKYLSKSDGNAIVSSPSLTETKILKDTVSYAEHMSAIPLANRRMLLNILQFEVGNMWGDV